MPKPRYYHPDYRQAEASAIVEALDRGQSVSLIGPPSVGKSNLLLFLDQTRLPARDPESPWLRYAPRSAEEGRVVAIYVDPNALLPALPQARGDVAARSWPGFELMIHRTHTAPPLYPRYRSDAGRDPDTELQKQIAIQQKRFEHAHPDVTAMDDGLHAHLALRHLESIISAALEAGRVQERPVRIAYFFDEFERMLNALPDFFFVALRSIRDRFKYQVMYVTVTRNSLPYLIDEERMATLEPFVELFHDRAIPIKPFNDEDAWRMIQQLEDKSVARDDYAVGLLIRATGGFAGLLRAGFQHVEALQGIRGEAYQKTVTLAATRLVAETNVQAECRTLLRGLNAEEIKTLFGVAAGAGEPSSIIAQELTDKSLLAPATHATGLRVNPPVLAAYIRNHPTPPAARATPRPVTLPEA